MSNNTENEDYTPLLQQYIDLYNLTMSSNSDRFPYCHIWHAALQRSNNTFLTFELIDDRPKASIPVMIAGDRLQQDRNPSNDNFDCEHRVMRVKMSELEKVMERPERCLANPSLLDWNWMMRAIRVASK